MKVIIQNNLYKLNYFFLIILQVMVKLNLQKYFYKFQNIQFSLIVHFLCLQNLILLNLINSIFQFQFLSIAWFFIYYFNIKPILINNNFFFYFNYSFNYILLFFIYIYHFIIFIKFVFFTFLYVQYYYYISI
jgi:hypothetical protein